MSNEESNVRLSGLVKPEGQLKTARFQLVVFPSGGIWLQKFDPNGVTGVGKQITPEQLERVLGDLWEFGF